MIEHGKNEIDALAGKFTGRMLAPSSSLESMVTESPAGGPDLSPSAVAERWGASRAFLLQFIREELGDDAKLVELAEKTLQDGKEGLELIGWQRDATEAPIDAVEAGLEVIVQTDGSRPAYFVRDNTFVSSSAPPSLWTDLLTDVLRQEAIEGILGSVGRIDISNFLVPFAGTGWLIGEDLIVTNRHVAQLFVDFFAADGPKIRSERDPHIDFGHEYRGQETVGRRPVIDLVFSGATPIPDRGINHSLLDMAVFRLGPSAPGPAQTVLPIGLGQQLASAQTQVIVVGYPAQPGAQVLGTVTETDRVLRLLFDKLWGYKRLAPGEIMTQTHGKRTLLHDASTLGGNSGSLVMGIDSVPTVTGLHYGGTWGQDRANWGHVMESLLDEEGLAGLRYPTLRALCTGEGVALLTPGP